MLTLRQIQSEWNALVPQARARGISRVSVWQLPPETRAYGMARLEKLRNLLGNTTAIVTGTVAPEFMSFTFGVEMECIKQRTITQSEIVSQLAGSNVPAVIERLNHTVRSHWKLTSDGSLGDYTNGMELVSPILQGDEGYRQLRESCRILTASGAKITKRCGLHVHVGVRNEGLQFFKNLIRMYAHYQTEIDTFVARSRRGYNNRWAAPIFINEQMLESAINLEQAANSIGQSVQPHNYHTHSGRYKKLNLHSFGMHGTAEFRHHQGSVEGHKVEMWVRLCKRMVIAARTWDVRTPRRPLLQEVGCDAEETRYWEGRKAHFARLDAESARRRAA